MNLLLIQLYLKAANYRTDIIFCLFNHFIFLFETGI